MAASAELWHHVMTGVPHHSQIIQWLWVLQGTPIYRIHCRCIVSDVSLKWAKTNPPGNMSGQLNPGWPGCCRPPNLDERRFIQAADWHSVSVVHSVPIPPDIKALLDNLSSRTSPGNVGGARGPSMPLMDRRNSANTNPSKNTSPSAKTSPVLVPSKVRTNGSPQLLQTNLTKPDSRGGGVPSSLPSTSAMDQYQSQRRQTSLDHADKSRSPSSRNSPSRRNAELDESISRRGAGSRRPTITGPPTPPMSVSKVTLDAQKDPQTTPPSLRHRASVSSTNLIKTPSPPSSRTAAERQNATVSSRPQSKRPSLEVSMAAVNISSAPNISSAISSSSSGSGGSSRGSMTDSTVTSDGGFTDYLSDESEAELQRQAEVKAAIVAQNQAEENEFKAARQQLAHVDLRPPKSWNPATNNSRLQSAINAYPGGTYPSAPYVQGAMAQAGAPARG